jgi:hypothetical protein
VPATPTTTGAIDPQSDLQPSHKTDHKAHHKTDQPTDDKTDDKTDPPTEDALFADEYFFDQSEDDDDDEGPNELLFSPPDSVSSPHLDAEDDDDAFAQGLSNFGDKLPMGKSVRADA